MAVNGPDASQDVGGLGWAERFFSEIYFGNRYRVVVRIFRSCHGNFKCWFLPGRMQARKRGAKAVEGYRSPRRFARACCVKTARQRLGLRQPSRTFHQGVAKLAFSDLIQAGNDFIGSGKASDKSRSIAAFRLARTLAPPARELMKLLPSSIARAVIRRSILASAMGRIRLSSFYNGFFRRDRDEHL